MVVGCRPRVVDVDERAEGKYAPDSACFSGFEASTMGDSTGLGSISCIEGAVLSIDVIRSATAMLLFGFSEGPGCYLVILGVQTPLLLVT